MNACPAAQSAGAAWKRGAPCALVLALRKCVLSGGSTAGPHLEVEQGRERRGVAERRHGADREAGHRRHLGRRGQAQRAARRARQRRQAPLVGAAGGQQHQQERPPRRHHQQALGRRRGRIGRGLVRRGVGRRVAGRQEVRGDAVQRGVLCNVHNPAHRHAAGPGRVPHSKAGRRGARLRQCCCAERGLCRARMPALPGLAVVVRREASPGASPGTRTSGAGSMAARSAASPCCLRPHDERAAHSLDLLWSLGHE